MKDMNSFRVPEQLLLPWHPKKTVSVAWAAEKLDASKGLVLRLIEEGRLKAYRLRDGSTSPFRINYDSFIGYLEEIHRDNDLEQRF
jgi:excisionase family DNA binding protein